MNIKYYDSALQDWIVTSGIIPAKLRWYDLVWSQKEVLLKSWCEHDIYVMLVNRNYTFDSNHRIYDDVKQYELNFDGYILGGQILKNKTFLPPALYGDNMEWQGTFRNKGAIIYTKDNANLICYVDYMFEAEVIEGKLTIEWSKEGILKIE